MLALNNEFVRTRRCEFSPCLYDVSVYCNDFFSRTKLDLRLTKFYESRRVKLSSEALTTARIRQNR